MRSLIAFGVAATMTLQAHATCSATSPAHTLALTELYTSDGCDSCPPANQWLSALVARGFGADQVVPLSLHVDYWIPFYGSYGIHDACNEKSCWRTEFG